jgi:hypothetical protein
MTWHPVDNSIHQGPGASDAFITALQPSSALSKQHRYQNAAGAMAVAISIQPAQ